MAAKSQSVPPSMNTSSDGISVEMMAILREIQHRMNELQLKVGELQLKVDDMNTRIIVLEDFATMQPVRLYNAAIRGSSPLGYPPPHIGGQNGLPLTIRDVGQLTNDEVIATSALLGLPPLPADSTEDERLDQFMLHMGIIL